MAFKRLVILSWEKQACAWKNTTICLRKSVICLGKRLELFGRESWAPCQQLQLSAVSLISFLMQCSRQWRNGAELNAASLWCGEITGRRVGMICKDTGGIQTLCLTTLSKFRDTGGRCQLVGSSLKRACKCI